MRVDTINQPERARLRRTHDGAGLHGTQRSQAQGAVPRRTDRLPPLVISPLGTIDQIDTDDGGIAMNPAQLADRHGMDRVERGRLLPVTMGTLRNCSPRVSEACRLESDACSTKGALLSKATLFLLRFIGVPARTESPDLWTYFASFGDDVFGDATTPQVRGTSTLNGAAFRYQCVRGRDDAFCRSADRSVRTA